MSKINYPIIFTHVPRSGGTTLNEIFKNNFPSDAQFEFEIEDYHGTTQESLKIFEKMSFEEKNKFLFLTGHINFGLHKYYENPCTYITFFRNPISRILSYYEIISKNPKHFLYRTVKDNNLSIESFLRLKLSTEFDNSQIRQISGIKGVRPGKCDEYMFEKAKENLEKFYPVFGLTEMYDESLLLLRKHLKLPNPYYILLNKGKNVIKNEIAQEIKEVIYETNALDMRFYEYALNKFNNSIKELGDVFQQEVIEFRKKNDMLRKIKVGNIPVGIPLWNYYAKKKYQRNIKN